MNSQHNPMSLIITLTKTSMMKKINENQTIIIAFVCSTKKLFLFFVFLLVVDFG